MNFCKVVLNFHVWTMTWVHTRIHMCTNMHTHILKVICTHKHTYFKNVLILWIWWYLVAISFYLNKTVIGSLPFYALCSLNMFKKLWACEIGMWELNEKRCTKSWLPFLSTLLYTDILAFHHFTSPPRWSAYNKIRLTLAQAFRGLSPWLFLLLHTCGKAVCHKESGCQRSGGVWQCAYYMAWVHIGVCLGVPGN